MFLILYKGVDYVYFKEYIECLKKLISPVLLLDNNGDIQRFMNNDNIFLCIQYIPIILYNYPHEKLFLVNTEQLTRQTELNHIITYPNDIKIIDYSLANIDILTSYGNMRQTIYHIPYSPIQSEIYNYEKIYDVCMIAPNSKRRTDIVDKIPNINTIYGWYDDRDNMLFKHKILVNVHCHTDFNIFESIRCNRCIFNKMIIITEKSNKEANNPLMKYVIECNYDEIPDMVTNVLNNYDEYYSNFFKTFDLQTIENELNKITKNPFYF